MILRRIFALSILMLGFASAVLAQDYFGRTDLTGTAAVDIENYMKGGIFFCNGDGNADSINVFLEIQMDSAYVRCAIYERTSGSSWQLIDSSAELVCPVDTAWYSFPLLENTQLIDGDQYALVVWAEQSPNWNCRIRSLEGPGTAADSMLFKSMAYGGWPTPTVPTLVWYYDVVVVCYYSGVAAPCRQPASIDDVVYRGAYIK